MNKCICFSQNNSDKRTLFHNNASLDIPYYTVLRVLDATREDEFIFTINNCPICGRSIKR